MVKGQKILIAGQSNDYVFDSLRSRGYKLFLEKELSSLCVRAHEEIPDLILVNLDHEIYRWKDTFSLIKKNHLLRYIPILILSENPTIKSRIEAAQIGISDLLAKPTKSDEIEELEAKILCSINNIKMALFANPLSKLPGNFEIQNHLKGIIDNQVEASVFYFDIDNFKSYNDFYGYAAGDNVIQRTAQLIEQIASAIYSSSDCFIGHVGGDDFVMITPSNQVEDFCKTLIREYDRLVPTLYDDVVSKTGFILGRDRQGITQQFSLISLSISVVLNRSGFFEHFGEIAARGAEIKKHLKAKSGSNYLIDRRKLCQIQDLFELEKTK